MTTNHPAHGPVSLERLHQISEILSKAAAQSDGGNIGYAMADAVKVIDGAIAAFGAEPVAIKCHVPHEAKGRIDPDEPNYSDGYRVGWNSCRAAMLQAGNSPVSPDGWIPVSDRMPEGMTDVHISNGHDVGQGWWDGDTWQTQHDYYSVPGDVTHWMPLPA
ncbi:DUF551 domain-containing protein, partial [Citrobacter freundii]|uniref:DUF551 domain-containing protein n=1 Tax=Citrobacter freundii TaxID=546 RepID=UPI0018FFF918